MKKCILFFAIAASFCTSCKKDVVPPPDPAPQFVGTTKFARSSASSVSSLSKVVVDSAGISADTIQPIAKPRDGYSNVE